MVFKLSIKISIAYICIVSIIKPLQISNTKIAKNYVTDNLYLMLIWTKTIISIVYYGVDLTSLQSKWGPTQFYEKVH